jgi:hypothetical protein
VHASAGPAEARPARAHDQPRAVRACPGLGIGLGLRLRLGNPNPNPARSISRCARMCVDPTVSRQPDSILHTHSTLRDRGWCVGGTCPCRRAPRKRHSAATACCAHSAALQHSGDTVYVSHVYVPAAVYTGESESGMAAQLRFPVLSTRVD